MEKELVLGLVLAFCLAAERLHSSEQREAVTINKTRNCHCECQVSRPDLIYVLAGSGEAPDTHSMFINESDMPWVSPNQSSPSMGEGRVRVKQVDRAIREPQSYSKGETQ